MEPTELYVIVVQLLLNILSVSSAEEATIELGCFKDNTTRRLTGYYYRDGNLSTTQCVNECKSRGFVYAALEVGIECYCGNSQIVLKEKVKDSECNFNCHGEVSKQCGGNWRLNLYSVQDCKKVTVGNASALYVGCFKEQAERRLVGHYFNNTINLTPEECIKECQHQGFLYAGLHNGVDCNCGNQQNILEERTLEDDCNVPCNGDTSKMCGGNLKLSLYSVGKCEQGFFDYMYLGCFKDYPDRRLSGYYLKDTEMTPLKCIESCKSRGLFYAGLQVGIECFCGNNRTALEDKVLEEECDFYCPGDKSKRCGAPWRNTIYSTSNIEKHSYIGCYKDDMDRKIKGQYFVIDQQLDGMTPAKCTYLCGQYMFMYAGLQVGVECFCGNQQLVEADKVSDSECNFGCTGDYAKQCGGNWRNTIYSTGYTLQDVQNHQKDSLSFLGCYLDSEERRRLENFFYKSESMIPEKCTNICRQLGYLFAGLQAGSECFCGDNHPDSADKVNDGDCNFPCFGDYSRKCGSLKRNSVYSTLGKSTGLSDKLYLGCFKDYPNRKLSGHHSKDTKMTPLKCIEFCKSKGFFYAGLQVGIECFCGNQGTALKDKVLDEECNFDCPGDKSKKCGSSWRNSIYKTGITSAIDQKYNYEGCYKPGPRNEDVHYQDFGFSLTPTICIESCLRHGYKFAALHLGTTCKCFSENHIANKLSNSSHCLTRCTGDQTKICGGINMDSVYNTGMADIYVDYKQQFIGCYNEDTQIVNKNQYFSSESTSVGMCITACKYDGYLFAKISNKNCMCGDNPLEHVNKVTDDLCQLPCTGESDKKCSGNEKHSLYKTGNTGKVPKIAQFGVKHLGCFKDQIKYSSLRAYIVDYQDQLYPKKCVEFCSRLGFKYTGLLSGSFCLCGNKQPLYEFLTPGDECNKRCTGDKQYICGGIARVTVYQSTIQSVDGEIDIRSRYLGCYRDKEDPRSLKGFYKRMDNLTPWKCVKECKKRNYLYAGLQVGSECFCGDQHPQLSERLPENSCNFQCFGDIYRFCGGNWANTIYHTSSMGSEARIAEIGFKYLGCYRDQENLRQLSSFYSNFDGRLTPLSCVELCKKLGYYYAGLQYGDKCFCGDNHPIPLDLVEEDECNSKCSGDVTKLCGGNRKNQIYATKNISPAFIQTEGLTYKGCFKDEESQRRLQGYFQDFYEKLTPIQCVTLCKDRGHIYAGLQNGSYCNCGDQYPSPLDLLPDNRCNSRCTGDTSKICGGITKNNIYASRYSESPIIGNVDQQYTGCFKKQTPVQLTGKVQNFTDLLTPEICIEFCKQAGHLYSGIYYSTWCYCGDSSPPQSDKVPEGECSSKCLGDVSKICGGPKAFTGYMISETQNEVEVPPSHTEKRCTSSHTTVNGGQTCRGSVVFEENFMEPLSRERWSNVVEFADESDLFVVFNSDKANSYTDDGKLIIKPSIRPVESVRRGKLNLTECTAKASDERCSRTAISYQILPPVQSARLTTLNSFSFRYGKVEVVAKLPVGDWIVPEIWLKPKEQAYGPDYLSGLINIGMSRGNLDLTLNSNDLSCKLLECGLMVGVGDVIKKAIVTHNLSNCWHEQFHNFTLIWTPDNIIFFIDGKETNPLIPSDYNLSNYLGFSEDLSSLWRFGSKIAPFDTEFYLHVGLSVGGSRNFPDGVLSNGRKKPWQNKELRAMLHFWQAQKDWEPSWVDGTALEIQYIKVTSI